MGDEEIGEKISDDGDAAYRKKSLGRLTPLVAGEIQRDFRQENFPTAPS